MARLKPLGETSWLWRYTQLLVIFRESETRVPSSRGLVKQYNQEVNLIKDSIQINDAIL